MLHAYISKDRSLSMKRRAHSGKVEFKPMEGLPTTCEMGSSL
ncbi:MAG: hypothetical protein ACYCPR_00995 [Thermoplasmataceae archaeon]